LELKSDTLKMPSALEAKVPSSVQVFGGGMPDEDPGDAMVTVLMHQVSNLMKEKAALLEENNQLKRDNEALQELVGYLAGEDDDEGGGLQGYGDDQD